MQETSSFHSETNRQPKTKKKTADKNLQYSPPFRSLHQNETEKNPKKTFSSTKTETKSKKNNFREKEKTYEKFVASQIHYNAESLKAERLSENGRSSLSSSGFSLYRAFGILGSVSSDPEVPIEVSS